MHGYHNNTVKASGGRANCFTRQPPYVTVNIKLGSFRVHWRGILVDRVLPVRPSNRLPKVCPSSLRDPSHNTSHTSSNSTAPDACGKVVVRGGEVHEELAGAVSDPARVRYAGGHATRGISSTTPGPPPYSRGIYAIPYAIVPKRPERTSCRPPAVFRHSVTRSMSRAPQLSHFHMRCHMLRHMSRAHVLLPEVLLAKSLGL